MPSLKTLSSREVVAILQKFGFVVQSQRGSHIKLRRVTSAGREMLIIPERKEIPKGTLLSVFKQASLYISATELFPYFYSK